MAPDRSERERREAIVREHIAPGPEGRITWERVYFDASTILRQLGLS